MKKIASLDISKIKEGMKCAVAVYTKSGVNLIERGTILTKELIDIIQKNKISILTVEADDSGSPMICDDDTETSAPSNSSEENTTVENGKLILKIDSPQAKENYSLLADRVKNFFSNVKTDNSIDINHIKSEVDTTLNNLFQNREAYLRLSMLKIKDQSLYVHSIDVCILASLIAKEFGFQNKDLNDIATCAILHDIGKMLLPDNLLDKSNSSNTESAMYKKHPFFGYEVLKKENFDERLANVVFEHHENFDGSGYPMKKYGVDSDIYSRIINISNRFTNLTKTTAPYRAAQMITINEKKKFDKDVLVIFEKVIGIYPNGTYVKLSDGSEARVIEQNKLLPLRPVIAITKKPDGNKPETIEVVKLFERRDLIIREVLDTEY